MLTVHRECAEPDLGPMYLPSPRAKGAFQADGLRALPLSAAGSGPHGDLPSLAHSLQSLDLPGLGDGRREAWPSPSQHVNIVSGGERVREGGARRISHVAAAPSVPHCG